MPFLFSQLIIIRFFERRIWNCFITLEQASLSQFSQLIYLSLKTSSSSIKTGWPIERKNWWIYWWSFLSQITLLKLLYTHPWLWCSESYSFGLFLASDPNHCSALDFPRWEILYILFQHPLAFLLTQMWCSFSSLSFWSFSWWVGLFSWSY